VVLDVVSGAIKRTIALQYDPNTLSHSYQVQGAGGDGEAERAQPFRLKGRPSNPSSSMPRSTRPIRGSIRTRTRMPVAFGIAPQLPGVGKSGEPDDRRVAGAELGNGDILLFASRQLPKLARSQ
jgi:hypothetical protein